MTWWDDVQDVHIVACPKLSIFLSNGEAKSTV